MSLVVLLAALCGFMLAGCDNGTSNNPTPPTNAPPSTNVPPAH